MKAIIMAGGFGTRLRPLTMTLPKPMVPMLNRPMMEHIVLLLKKHGFTELTSLLYFHPEAITSYFGDGSAVGVSMDYVRAEADFGTAGSVRNATEQLQLKERILIISGDVLTDFDLTEALRFHEEKKALATIVLTRVKNPLQFGVVMTDEQHRITRFLEKPTWGEVFSDTINTGIYILEPEAYEMIPYKKEFDFSKDLFPSLLTKPDALFGYIAEGYWRDIGNLNEYHEAHMDALSGKVKLSLLGKEEPHVHVQEGTVTTGATFEGENVIGKNVFIAPGASLTNSVVGDNSRIEEGAVLESTVLWQSVQVGPGANMSNAVACAEVSIGSRAIINEHVFIGERSQIGDDAEVMQSLKLWPDKKVDDGAKVSTSLVWEDRWTRTLFTNSRISGASNIEITPEFTAKVGGALGALVGMGQTVVISRDSDPGSRVISRALTSGLMSAGVNVNDMQETPIPLARHHLRGGRQSAGVHIRKNPIDKHRSDLIFFDAGGFDLPTGRGKSVERYFFGEDFPRAPYDKVGTIEFPAHTGESYTKRFKSSLNIEQLSRCRYRIVVDYANGITSTIFPNILGSLGAEVVSLNGYLEPTRLTRAREEFERSLKHLANVVASLKYQIGFILDAGGERIALVDENGQAYVNNRLLTLMTKLFFESEKAKGNTIKQIAVPISASSEIEILAQEYGCEILYTKNTHDAMMKAATTENVAYVGGTLGGFIFSDYFFAVDAMYTVAKTMEMLSYIDKTIAEVAETLPKRFQTRRQVFCPTEELGTVMRNAMDHARGMEKVLVDGIKFYLDKNAWVLVIPDKERPYCDVVAESEDAKRSNEMAEQYAKYVFDWRTK